MRPASRPQVEACAKRRYSAARGGLWSRRDRQGDFGRAAARRHASISSTAWRRTSPASMRGSRRTSATTTSHGFSPSRERRRRRGDSAIPSASTMPSRQGRVADAKENAGARYFKLKLRGDPGRMWPGNPDRQGIGRAVARLRRHVDANEQYADLGALRERPTDSTATRRCGRSRGSYYISRQPMPRDITRASPLGALARRIHHRRGR